MLFIACGEEPNEEIDYPKQVDWKQDYLPISSGVSKSLGVVDVRSLPYLHWFTFISGYYEIGDGQLAYLCMIRNKLRRNEKLTKEEKEFVGLNREKVHLKQDKISEQESKELRERFA